MRRSKTSLAISVMTAILLSASLMPAQIRAEEEISEEPEQIEETALEEENEEIVSEETDEAVTEEESEEVSNEESVAEEENAEDDLSAYGPVSYFDENGKSYICSSYTNLSDVQDQPGATLTSGWYVAEGSGWGFNNRVTILGDVNVILADNCHVIFNRGIQNNQYPFSGVQQYL